MLEAGSDVFPNDPRPVAFAVDHRFRDGSVRAEVSRPGAAPGVVVRRVSPRAYYAAIYDVEQAGAHHRPPPRDRARARWRADRRPRRGSRRSTLTLRATRRAAPTLLEAVLVTRRRPRRSSVGGARRRAPELQRPGDAGVLATAQTLLPSGSPVLPALGNLHLLPYAVQEGQAFIESPAGQAFVDEIRRRSTVAFRTIVIEASRAAPGGPGHPSWRRPPECRSRAEPGCTWPPMSPPRSRSSSPLRASFRRRRVVKAGRTGDFAAVAKAVRSLPPGRRVYWRARLRRRGRGVRGPARSFRVLPRAGGRGRLRLAIASCGTQFGPIFDHLAARRPDVLVWQGDLNYPDTHGPLAQTASGYGGIWRDFLANPRLAPVLATASFAAQRDDHDYGLQDAHSSEPAGLWRSRPGRR